MQMKDNLSSRPAAVDHKAVARLGFVKLSHALGYQNHLRNDARGLLVQGIERIHMPLGNDQQVNGGIGVDVFEYDQFFVFVDDSGWQLMGHNLTKDAGHPLPPEKIINIKNSLISLKISRVLLLSQRH
jgi:hypothetical protein